MLPADSKLNLIAVFVCVLNCDGSDVNNRDLPLSYSHSLVIVWVSVCMCVPALKGLMSLKIIAVKLHLLNSNYSQ